MKLFAKSPAPSRRFLVALAFPASKREFVRCVAEALAKQLGRERIFFDNWYRAELAQPDLDLILGDIYRKHAELVVPFFCQAYGEPAWCGLEWRQMQAVLQKGDGGRLMPFRFDRVTLPGSLSGNGYADIAEATLARPADFVTPEQVAASIIARLGPVHATPAAPVAPQVIDALHQIPPPPVKFTGRAKELEALHSHPCTYDEAHAIVISGAAGTGKTALALALAQTWKASFPDGHVFLDGRGAWEEAMTPGDLMAEVIHAFEPEAKLPDGLEGRNSSYRRVLAGKHVLILADDARDHAQVAPLFPPPGSVLLITSRYGFKLKDQSPHEVSKLVPAEAVELMRRYYARLSDDEAGELVEQCGSLPLALKLAGSRLAMDAVENRGMANVEGFLAELTASNDGPVSMLNTARILHLSEKMLTESQRGCWLGLSVMRSSFDERAALAVAGAGEGILDLLVRRGLLERQGERLRMHDLAADYARLVREPAMLEAGLLACAKHFVAVCEEAGAACLAGGEEMTAGLRIFDAERSHFDAVFSWLCCRADAESAKLLISLVNAVQPVSALRFSSGERIRWLEAQRDAARLAGSRAAEGNALGNLGKVHTDLGDADKAVEFYSERLAIARTAGDRRAEAAALNNLGVAHSRGDVRKAIECYEQRLVIAREIGDRRGEGIALGNLGVAHKTLGDTARAFELYVQQLAIARETKDRRGEGNALWNSAILHGQLGDLEAAILRAEEALEIYESVEAPAAARVRNVLERWKAPARNPTAAPVRTGSAQ
ncbi:MAG TPA: tetratricopeptide repeat protein [Verrucomicrobiales bacterium]|nr:tetratricopeptide repeat protein [Verrucomicrobiales bacterium]